MSFIPVNEPLVGKKELKYVSDALKTGWISSEGEYLKAFEKGFAAYVGVKHGVAVNNGTSALILALRALDLPAGSEVIMPSFTIVSCALACVYNGLVPVFVDSERDTFNADVKQVAKAITKRTKAIMAVHIYGHPADMGAMRALARKHKLLLIEDFAEAIGSEYKGRLCGSLGDVSCASFYANKVITTGEGGMCLTNSDALAEKMRDLRNLSHARGARFVHYELGHNFRMTNVQAAIGLGQLETVKARVKRKIEVAALYTKLLKPLEKEGLLTLPVQKKWAKNTYWMYGVLLNRERGVKAAEVMKAMGAKGVQTRPFFYPMHLQPAFKAYKWFKKQSLPVSEELYDYGFYLPSGLTLTGAQVKAAALALKEVLHGLR
ncbi:MAG: DegT/DnrJ/EryC1/StrS family aminotransferase [Elusimicrobia bacterium]|nr:DegT/DnrJ/EryC1/StrS family aminotransferase [Elusimicrobiota bacterium]